MEPELLTPRSRVIWRAAFWKPCSPALLLWGRMAGLQGGPHLFAVLPSSGFGCYSFYSFLNCCSEVFHSWVCWFEGKPAEMSPCCPGMVSVWQSPLRVYTAGAFRSPQVLSPTAPTPWAWQLLAGLLLHLGRAAVNRRCLRCLCGWEGASLTHSPVSRLRDIHWLWVWVFAQAGCAVSAEEAGYFCTGPH